LGDSPICSSDTVSPMIFEPAGRDPDKAAATAEEVRISRLREDARRPMSVNLAETIALSHKLIQMAGAARHN
jgi:hypothetical protein